MVYDSPVQRSVETFSYRDFSRIDYNELENLRVSINWEDIFLLNNIDDQVSMFQDNITFLYDSCLPIRAKTVSNRRRPWFCSDIGQAIRQRDLAYSRWKRLRTDELKDEFRAARRHANSVIKRAKIAYYNNRFQTALGTKNTWKRDWRREFK
ncbi:uncharacterized protein LOC142231470 [Haematobia irritans]|uniref:uncharacterized protein LOC142231470 n=1 Tax=Haematobia irritans TaxID=7368 RepID=UPI003F506A94